VERTSELITAAVELLHGCGQRAKLAVAARNWHEQNPRATERT